MEDRPKRLKADIFPYDDLDFEALLRDLAVEGFIIRYVVDGQKCICIPEDSWDKHQRPRKDEHESVLPSVSYATETYSSLSSDGTVTAQCVGNRENGIGNRKVWNREVGGVEDTSADADSPPAKSRAGDLMDLWNTCTHPPIPRCRELTNERKQKIRSRLSERPIEQWREVFDRIARSSFLRGDGGGWCASFDWIIKNQENATRVLEGKYDDRAGPNDVDAAREAFLRGN